MARALSCCVAVISRTAHVVSVETQLVDTHLPYPCILALGIEQIGHELAEPALLCSFHCNLFRDHLSGLKIVRGGHSSLSGRDAHLQMCSQD